MLRYTCFFAQPYLPTVLPGNSQASFGMCAGHRHQPSSSQEILEQPSENRIPYPNRSLFLRGPFFTTPDAELARSSADPKARESAPHPAWLRDYAAYFVLNHLSRITCEPCAVSEQPVLRSLALPPIFPANEALGPKISSQPEGFLGGDPPWSVGKSDIQHF